MAKELEKEIEVKEEKVQKPAKRWIVVPVNERNPEDTYVTTCVNGKVTQIMRGTEVEVDEVVYNLLKEGGYLGIK